MYRTFLTLPLPMLLLSAGATLAATGAADTAKLEGLKWRLIGPYRGGRVTTVTGVPGKPNLYYMGATGGGVWKTVKMPAQAGRISRTVISKWAPSALLP